MRHYKQHNQMKKKTYCKVNVILNSPKDDYEKLILLNNIEREIKHDLKESESFFSFISHFLLERHIRKVWMELFETADYMTRIKFAEYYFKSRSIIG